jgi:hypothetical protein
LVFEDEKRLDAVFADSDDDILYTGKKKFSKSPCFDSTNHLSKFLERRLLACVTVTAWIVVTSKKRGGIFVFGGVAANNKASWM